MEGKFNWVWYQHFWGVYSEAFANYSSSITAKISVYAGDGVAKYEFSKNVIGKFTSNAVYWYSGDAESQYNKISTNYKWMVLGK